jgi:polyisoprenoid-binding protein YceI
MGKALHHRLAGIVGLAIVVGVAGWSGAAGASESCVFDPAHTSATFRIEHLGISWVSGRFDDVSGKCSLDKTDPTKSTCEVTIKATSINTNNAQRDKHLRSEDFFNVEQFPEMTFKSTSVQKATATEPADADASYDVTGDFTMHGVTKPVTFILRGGKEAEFPKGTQRIGFFAEFSLKRSDYGMSKLPGAVGDVVKITVSVEAIKQ